MADTQAIAAPQAQASTGSSRPSGDGLLALGLAASLLLLGLACRELLRFAPRTRLELSADDFFFQPSDSSPAVVVLLCGWLLWRRRKRLARVWGLRGHWALTGGLWALAAGIFAWSVRFGATELQAVALVPALLGAGNLLGGVAAMRVMALPAVVLLFAVPVPAPLLNQILWPLQLWTAELTGAVIAAMGLAVFVSGDQIIMKDSLFQIIETCSGMRAIETLGMLSILMIDLFERRGWHAVALVAASLPIAFVVNLLRCVGLIFNPHADIASIHSLQGIAMLLCGVLMLYALDCALAGIPSRRSAVSETERRARALPPSARGRLRPRVAGLVGFAAVFAGLSLLPEKEPELVIYRAMVKLVPEQIGDWSATQRHEVDGLFYGRALFRDPLHRTYRRDQSEVDLFVGQSWPSHRMRSYLSPKAAYPGSGWRVEHEERSELAGREVTLRVLRKGTERDLVAHWFEASPGVWSESARTLLALDRMDGLRPLPMVVRLSTPLATGLGSEPLARARDRLEAFLTEASAVLESIPTGSQRSS